MKAQPQWRKSTYSGQQGDCVEVATNVPTVSMIRDSKLGDASPVLDVSPETFGAFIQAVKADRLS